MTILCNSQAYYSSEVSTDGREREDGTAGECKSGVFSDLADAFRSTPAHGDAAQN